MGIFGRMGTVIKANLNDLISRAEDPEKMLNQMMIDMKETLVEAKRQVAVVIADEKRLKLQYESERAQAQEWEKKAMLAVRAGDDNLAKEALARKAEHENLAAEYMKQWEAQKAAADQLRDSLRALNKKIEEAGRKKNLLIAKKKRAEAQKTIHHTMAGLSDTSAFDTFERMAQKIEQAEAEAQAAAELSATSQEASLEEKFRKLEQEKGPDVDDALAALKAKMGMAPAALPAQQGQKVEIPVAATRTEKEPVYRK
jgi:phage shock protein A